MERRVEWNWPVIGIWIISALLALVIITYVIKGMTCDEAAATSSCDEERARLQAGLDEAIAAQAAAQAASVEAISRASAMQSQLESCNAGWDKLRSQSEALVDSLDEDLQECRQLAKGAEDAADIIGDAARRLCCVQRVENPAIDSYTIEGKRIVCVADGENPVDC